MGQIIFTEFELQVLETARIVGGKGETPIQCHCTSTITASTIMVM